MQNGLEERLSETCLSAYTLYYLSHHPESTTGEIARSLDPMADLSLYLSKISHVLSTLKSKQRINAVGVKKSGMITVPTYEITRTGREDFRGFLAKFDFYCRLFRKFE